MRAIKSSHFGVAGLLSLALFLALMSSRPPQTRQTGSTGPIVLLLGALKN
jgi:hypothetical protein